MLPILAALAGPAELRVDGVAHTLSHPGLSVGVGTTLIEGERFSFGTAGELGAYWHPRYQVATWLRGEVFGRHSGARGGVHELFVATGPLRATWAVPSVRYDAGDIRRTPLSGDTFWTATVGLGLGRRSSGIARAWVVRPQLTARFPTFYRVGWDAMIQFGARFGGAR